MYSCARILCVTHGVGYAAVDEIAIAIAAAVVAVGFVACDRSDRVSWGSLRRDGAVLVDLHVLQYLSLLVPAAG